MEKGIIKWFDNKKGFGFIAREGGGQDIFVHFSCITGEGFKTLEEGDHVEYEASESDKGLKASRVHKLGGASADGTVHLREPNDGAHLDGVHRDGVHRDGVHRDGARSQ